MLEVAKMADSLPELSISRETASYLLGIPLLSDFLKDGLSKLGGSCVEFETEHL
jgi:hypothetical protein